MAIIIYNLVIFGSKVTFIKIWSCLEALMHSDADDINQNDYLVTVGIV
jgi:hypothetical protein